MRLTPTRIVGCALLGASLLPLHRLLDPARTGPAGASVRAAAEAAWSVSTLGTASVLLAAALLGSVFHGDRLRSALGAFARALTEIPARFFHPSVGALALALGSYVALRVHGGMPTSVDEMVQLLHARALAEGSLTLPVEHAGAAWAVQNGLFTDRGWASVYPPGHTLLLAGAWRLGVAWLVGPAAIGLATGLCSAAFERLLEDRRCARIAALLLALAPFWLLLGATHLSHPSAAAAAALVLWTALRARDGGGGWAAATGAAVGLFVTIRPWTGLALSAAMLIALGRSRPRPRGRSLALVVAGGAPFAALLLWWNATLFGSPFTLGYGAAFGPAHGLGLHVDPWGNAYGVLEAVAYTGADLIQLAAHLFESPLSPIVLIAVGLLARSLPVGAGALLVWALGGVAANALYWHHGVHMGPRMLFETVPAWVALTVLAGAALVRPGAHGDRGRLSSAALWALLLAGLGTAWLAPSTVAARAGLAVRTPKLPDPPQRPAIVFVHGSWSSRIAARLGAAGMRRDSIETVLRRNDVCRADAYARARLAPGEEPDAEAPAAQPIDLRPAPGSPNSLRVQEVSPGNAVRVDPTLTPSPTCLRAARADRFGVVELEPFLWRAPPLPGSDVWVARDMGPAENAAVIGASERRPYVWLEGPRGPRLLDYETAMELLWGGAASAGPGDL